MEARGCSSFTGCDGGVAGWVASCGNEGCVRFVQAASMNWLWVVQWIEHGRNQQPK